MARISFNTFDRQRIRIQRHNICSVPWSGLDGHFSNGKLQYKNFADGVTWAMGLILFKTPISGSSTTTTTALFPLFSIMLSSFFHVPFVYRFHIGLLLFNAARHIGSKSKSKSKVVSHATWKRNKSYHINVDTVWPHMVTQSGAVNVRTRLCERGPLQGAVNNSHEFGKNKQKNSDDLFF